MLIKLLRDHILNWRCSLYSSTAALLNPNCDRSLRLLSTSSSLWLWDFASFEFCSLLFRFGTSRNSILGMQCEAQNVAIRRYCEALQRNNAPYNWIYRGAEIYSPIFTIRMALVPPTLPICSPQVATIKSPAFTAPLSSKTFSASFNTRSRSGL